MIRSIVVPSTSESTGPRRMDYVKEEITSTKRFETSVNIYSRQSVTYLKTPIFNPIFLSLNNNEIFQAFKINFEIKNLICIPVKEKSTCVIIEHVKEYKFLMTLHQ